MSVFKKCVFVFAVVISAAEAWGQAARSPFTTYGLGDPYGNSLIQNHGMGGTGVAQPQVWYLNNQNPALLVYNNLTVFQVGITGESRTVKGDTTNEQSRGGNLNYLAVAFPVKTNRWTTSVGLMPYSNVNYSLSYLDNVYDATTGAIVDSLVAEETGSGGLTQLYWSNGVRLTKEMSVGLKATYVFGPISNTYAGTPTGGQSVPYVVTIEDKTNVNSFMFGLGYSYSKDSLGAKQNHRLSFGAMYNFAARLRGTNYTQSFRTTANGLDTLELTKITETSGHIKVPAAFTVGASYARDGFWSVATEFSYQDWSGFENIGPDKDELNNAWRAALGGEYTIDPLALESYLKRITWRIGGTYEQYPYLVNGNAVRDLGATFGFSLPAGRSSIDLALKVGKRGNKAENVLEESYFKIFFGITFNDQWFIKRKFD